MRGESSEPKINHVERGETHRKSRIMHTDTRDSREDAQAKRAEHHKKRLEQHNKDPVCVRGKQNKLFDFILEFGIKRSQTKSAKFPR